MAVVFFCCGKKPKQKACTSKAELIIRCFALVSYHGAPLAVEDLRFDLTFTPVFPFVSPDPAPSFLHIPGFRSPHLISLISL